MELEALKNLKRTILKRVWGAFFLLSEEGIRSRGFVYFLITVNAVQLFSYHAYFTEVHGSTNSSLFELLFKAARAFRLISFQPYLGIFSPFLLLFSYHVILLLLLLCVGLTPPECYQNSWRKAIRKVTYTMMIIYEWALFLPCTEIIFRENLPRVFLPDLNPDPVEKYHSNSYAFLIVYVVIFAIVNLVSMLRGFVSIAFKDTASNYFARTRRASHYLLTLIRFLAVVIATKFEGTRGGDLGIDLTFIITIFGLIIAEPFTAVYYDQQVASLYANGFAVNWILSWPLLYFHTQQTGDPMNKVALVSAFGIAFGLKLYNIIREAVVYKLIMKRRFTYPFALEVHLRFLASYSASVTVTPGNAMKFYSYILYHNQECNNPECECHKIMEHHTKSQSLRVDGFLQSQIHNFIIRIYREFFEYYSRDRKLIFPFYIGYLSLLTFSMQKKATAYTQALNFLGKIDKNSYDVTIMDFVTEEILFELGKDLDPVSSDFFHLQISDALDFSQKGEQFESQIEKLKEIHTEFFSHLLKDEIDLDYVYLQGRSYLHVRKDIQSLFETCIQLNPTSVEVLERYIYYHKHVIESPVSDYQKWDTRKNDLILKNIYTDNHLTLANVGKEIWNAENGVIYISLDFSKTGIIEAITPACRKILGLKSSKEALGKNISDFMPSAFGRYHNDILRRFAARPEADFSSKNEFTLLFALDSEGFLVPFRVVIKLESYKQRPTVAGILKPLKEDYVGLFTCWDGKIQNYTRKFKEVFKLQVDDCIQNTHICLFIPKLIKYMHLTTEEDTLYNQLAENKKKFYLFISKKVDEKRIRNELDHRTTKLYEVIQGLLTPGLSEEQRLEAKKTMRKLTLEIPRGLNVEDYNVFKITLTMKRLTFYNGNIKLLLVRFIEWEIVSGLLQKTNIMKKIGFYSKGIIRTNGNTAEKLSKWAALQPSKSESEIPRLQLVAVENTLNVDSRPRSHSSVDQKQSSSGEIKQEQNELEEIALGQTRKKSSSSKQSKDERLLHDTPELSHLNATVSDKSFNANASKEFSENHLKLYPVASDIVNATKLGSNDNTNEFTHLEPLTLRQDVSVKDIRAADNFIGSTTDRKKYSEVPSITQLKEYPSSPQNMLGNPFAIRQASDGLIKKLSSVSSKRLRKETSDIADKTTSQITMTELDESLKDAESSSDSRSQARSTITDRGSEKRRRANDARNSKGSSHQMSDSAKKFYRDVINSTKISIFLRGFNSLGILYGCLVISVYITIALVIGRYFDQYIQLDWYLNASPIIGAGVTSMAVQLSKTALILDGVAAYNVTALVQSGAVPAGVDEATLYSWDTFWVNWGTAINNMWIVEGVNNYTTLEGVEWISGSLLDTKKVPYVLTGIDGPAQKTEIGLSVYLNLVKYYSHAVNYYDILSTIDNSTAYYFFLDNRHTLLNLTADLDANNWELVENLHDRSITVSEALEIIAFVIVFVVVFTFYLAVRRAAQLRESILALFSKISVTQILTEVKKFATTSEQNPTAGRSQGKGLIAKERIFSKYKIQRNTYNLRSILIFATIYVILILPPLIMTRVTQESFHQIVTLLTAIADVSNLVRQINNFQASAYILFDAYDKDKETRSHMYETDFMPAYNQVLTGTKNFQTFLRNLGSNYDLLDQNTLMFIGGSVNGEFCQVLPAIDPVIYGIDFSTFSFDIALIGETCVESFGGISSQGIIVSQFNLISVIAQDAQKAVSLEAGDLAGIHAITSSLNFYYYDKFGLYVSYYYTVLTSGLIASGANLVTQSNRHSIIASVASIFLTMLFFAFGWLHFLRKSNGKLRRAKEILIILPYSILSKNVYIESFLLKESRKEGIN